MVIYKVLDMLGSVECYIVVAYQIHLNTQWVFVLVSINPTHISYTSATGEVFWDLLWRNS